MPSKNSYFCLKPHYDSYFKDHFKSHRWNSKVSQDPQGIKAANTLEIIQSNSLSPWFTHKKSEAPREEVSFPKLTFWARCRIGTKPEASCLPDQGFSISTLLTFGVRSFFHVRGCYVHCWTFSSIPALYPLDAIATPQPMEKTKKCFWTLLSVMGGGWAKSSPDKNQGSERMMPSVWTLAPTFTGLCDLL